jgi:ribosomal-protein-alanine N-acetyltransferase
MMDLWPALETERIILRKIRNTDIEFIFQHFSNPDVCRYLVDAEPVKTLEEAQEIIDWCNLESEAPSNNRWLIVWKETQQPIGTCGFHRWDTTNNIAETGYDLTRPFWNRGVMTEALTRIIPFGFDQMMLNRIQAFVHIENIASYTLLKKLGFHMEGIIRDKHFFRGKYYDHYGFSLLKSDWMMRKTERNSA